MRFRIIAIGVASAVAAGAGFLHAAATGNLANPSEGPDPVYEVNELGMTYGSALDATSPDNEPDLIKAFGVDGTVGYVRSEDVNLPAPATREEARAQQDIGATWIPLYAVDGTTVIGEFKIPSAAASDAAVDLIQQSSLAR